VAAAVLCGGSIFKSLAQLTQHLIIIAYGIRNEMETKHTKKKHINTHK